ncbi:hypothetical protein C8Q75DRAFT_734439 [Abortiporus biennis]|nr:hypothetical protein C8Q75DRAFT_734439 [Abortiporus biennis]
MGEYCKRGSTSRTRDDEKRKLVYGMRKEGWDDNTLDDRRSRTFEYAWKLLEKGSCVVIGAQLGGNTSIGREMDTTWQRKIEYNTACDLKKQELRVHGESVETKSSSNTSEQSEQGRSARRKELEGGRVRERRIVNSDCRGRMLDMDDCLFGRR